ncbi:DUF3011 domain-containing protein [Bdellovibrio bacteriovorus]|uniref:DUF3011 domain-containing protein n=1 Tax=Bdellovibrio bacteriovorus TaxID=959 RepID=UPI0021D0E7E0|nr:DUF3011 domain-containing protein [Bdellovibrio bacteriovorus]UXR64722.1 DUF3011 domain-containing protein [Bdellovibrio bacteriovorus]
MKNLFFALLLTVGFATVAQADVFESQQDPETSYIRPGPRPAPYPGNPRPDPYPAPNPRPNPPPAPYPNPYPPGGNARYEYVNCESWNYNYQECYIGAYGVRSIRIYNVFSYDACLYNQTFGFYNDRIWVNRGCRATFEVLRVY